MLYELITYDVKRKLEISLDNDVIKISIILLNLFICQSIHTRLRENYIYHAFSKRNTANFDLSFSMKLQFYSLTQK